MLNFSETLSFKPPIRFDNSIELDNRAICFVDVPRWVLAFRKGKYCILSYFLRFFTNAATVFLSHLKHFSCLRHSRKG